MQRVATTFTTNERKVRKPQISFDRRYIYIKIAHTIYTYRNVIDGVETEAQNEH